MAFIKLTIQDPAPYGETEYMQAYINTNEIVEVSSTRIGAAAASSIRMRDGRTMTVTDRPEAAMRKIAGVEL